MFYAVADAPVKASNMEEEQQDIAQALQIGVLCAWAVMVALEASCAASQPSVACQSLRY